jgi:CheY-like chemotaxis protein
MNPLIYTRPLRTVVLPEGLARFDPSVHQVVLTDFLKPGLTGLEGAAAIRAQGCTTPIVMISGYPEPNDQRRAVGPRPEVETRRGHPPSGARDQGPGYGETPDLSTASARVPEVVPASGSSHLSCG